MRIILLTPLFILSCTLLLHYYQHFKLVARRRPKLSLINVSKDRVQRRIQCPSARPHWCHCCCGLAPIDQSEKYNFFPTSFLYFIILQIVICTLILCLDAMIPHHSALLIPMHRTHSWHQWQSVSTSDISEFQGPATLVVICDYILIHSVMIISIWFSLFAFYKFYTTYKIVINVETVPAAPVIMRFMIYALGFTLLFSTQMHFYYYLWPALLLLHAIFNAVCVIKFASVLINKYQLFINDRKQNKDDASILRSVYLMRRISVICSVLQTAALALFTISYSVDTIYFLPILWSVSTAIYSFNFVRNRKYLAWKWFQCLRTLKCRSVFGRNETRSAETKKKTPATNDSDSIRITVMPPSNGTVTCAKFSHVTLSTENTVKSEVSSAVSKELSGRHVRFAVEVHTSSFQPDEPEPGARRPTNKALHILGIGSQSHSIKRCPRPKLNAMAKSQSDIISSPVSPALKSVSSQSDITPQNHFQFVIGSTPRQSTIEDVEESEASRSYFPQVPLRRLSSPFMAGELVIPSEFCNGNIPKRSTHIGLGIEVDAIDHIDSEDEEFEKGCVIINGFDHEEAEEEDPSLDALDFVDLNDDTLMPPQSQNHLKHQKSSSDPVVQNDIETILQNMNVAQVMDSLDLFAKYGFCSRNSINSLYQLTRYKNKIRQIPFHSPK